MDKFRGCIRIPIAKLIANRRVSSGSFHTLPTAKGVKRLPFLTESPLKFGILLG